MDSGNSGFFTSKVSHPCKVEDCEATVHRPYHYCEECRAKRDFEAHNKAKSVRTPLHTRIHRGDSLGRWTVIGYTTQHDEQGRNHKIRCRCVCGHEAFVPLKKLSPYWVRRYPMVGCRKRSCQNEFKSRKGSL